ncbi:MAG: hypothetical protein SV429_12170, partial [Pseudomonadota bacterium]|nr:hypothetical protein [Pseudomonadota bacterium]
MAAIISGFATVLAAFVGIIGLLVMLKLETKLKMLADEVQKYHAHEGRLVGKILELRGTSRANCLTIKKETVMTGLTSSESQSSKDTLADKSLTAMAPAITIAVVIAAVLLFTPWYAVEDPFFGMLISVNAFDANSPLLETVIAYPLIGLYLIAVGCICKENRDRSIFSPGFPEHC